MTAPDVDICEVLERHVAEGCLPTWVDSALTRAAAELRQTRKRERALRNAARRVLAFIDHKGERWHMALQELRAAAGE
jgi:hypothetical protein